VTTSPGRNVRSCPICGKLASEAARPFCSAACKSVDLHRWLTGSYVIPASDDEEGTDEGGKE
jgi:endogenous inhibitor of DNA gyrase (YacG/DUF329 family)